MPDSDYGPGSGPDAARAAATQIQAKYAPPSIPAWMQQQQQVLSQAHPAAAPQQQQQQQDPTKAPGSATDALTKLAAPAGEALGKEIKSLATAPDSTGNPGGTGGNLGGLY